MTAMARTIVLHKRPDHPSFGIYIGEDFPSGIYIVTIERNSPAAAANIRPGDRILAFNGQLVASMSKNPKDELIQTAASAQTLTLSIQSVDVLDAINGTTPSTSHMEAYPHSSQLTNTVQAINGSTSSNWDNQTHRYPSQTTQRIDGDLESYIKSLFSDPTLQIVAAPSGNHNEFVLISDKTPSLSSFPPPQYQYPHQHQHRRKRRHHSRKEMSSAPYSEPNENSVPLSPVRSVPSMGTSHAMLRNSQTNSKDSAQNDQQDSRTLPTNNNQPPSTNNNPTIRQLDPIHLLNQSNNPAPQPSGRQASPAGFPPPYTPAPLSVNNQANSGVRSQPFNGVSQLVNTSVNPTGIPPATRASTNVNGPPPVSGQNVREVHLRRLPDYQGFGFHLQYNKVYYIISSVESNSPAERGGLRVNDVVREVNRRPTDRMPHDDFVNLINRTNDVTFIVQPFDDYFRANPSVPAKPNADRPANIVRNDADKRPNMLTKALTKLKSR